MCRGIFISSERCGVNHEVQLVCGVILATPLEARRFMVFLSCPLSTVRSAADTDESFRSKALSGTRMSEKHGAKTSPGSHTKFRTALKTFNGHGSAIAASNSPANLVSSILHRF